MFISVLVKEQMSERPSNTLHQINRVKLFMETSAIARLLDILSGWKPADVQNKLKQDSWWT